MGIAVRRTAGMMNGILRRLVYGKESSQAMCAVVEYLWLKNSWGQKKTCRAVQGEDECTRGDGTSTDAWKGETPVQ